MVKPIDVKIETKGLQPAITALENMSSKGMRLRPLMATIGDIMYAGVIENFEAEGRPGKWQKRKDFTNEAYGNTAYDGFKSTKRGQSLFANSSKYKRSENALNRSKASLFDRASSNKILHNSGDLRKSIDRYPTANSVAIGSNLIYARIHQFGGVIKPKNGKCLCIPVGGGKIIKVKSVTIPARPYLVITDKENRKIISTVRNYYKESLENGNR